MTDPAPRSIAEVCDQIEAIDGVSLRPWAPADVHVLLHAWDDERIAHWNPVPPEPTVALADSWIRRTASQNEASVGIDVVLVRDDDVLGEIGLQIDVEQVIAEVGFWLTDRARGSGVGRTMLTLAQELSSELELRGLIALVHADNDAALGLLARAGWVEIPTTSERRAFAYRTPA